MLPNSTKDTVDAHWLSMLGLLWCRGDDLTKAQMFTDLISVSDAKDDNFEEDEEIEADDDRLAHFLRSLFYLATIFTVSVAISSTNRTFKPDERLVLVRYVYSGYVKLSIIERAIENLIKS